MHFRRAVLVFSVVALTGCAAEDGESTARYLAVPSATPQPEDDRSQWCEPAPAEWDERLGLTVYFEKTQSTLTIHYTATNNRTSPVYAINRIQQATGSASPRERHFVVPRSDNVIEVSQRKLRYRSPNCLVQRAVPLPPLRATRITPGSGLEGTVHVPLPLGIQHPEGTSAVAHLPPLTGPPYSVSFCLGFSPTAGPSPHTIDGETQYGDLAAGPETVACSTPLELS